MRMIVVFQKSLALRHIGHLDLMRAMQRALRRSNLPICYSKGFNPHINLSFASPLSVGVVGMHEIMDVPVNEPCEAEVFQKALAAALPPALPVISVRAVEDNFPTLMALVAGSQLRMCFEASEDTDKVALALDRFMHSDECVTLRRTKSGENMTNIRPFVATASCEKADDGYTIRCEIRNRPEGSLKPAVLMQALFEMADVEPIYYLAYRDRILTSNKDGTMIPLEAYENA